MFERKTSCGDDNMFGTPEGVKRYAEHMNADGISYKAFFAKLKTLPVSGRVLDVGAGPGGVAAKVAAMFPDCRITALEVSPMMADYGNRHIESEGLTDRIEYMVGDAATDLIAGQKAGCRTFLVLTGRGFQQLLPALHAVPQDFIISRNLMRATTQILNAELAIADENELYTQRYHQVLPVAGGL